MGVNETGIQKPGNLFFRLLPDKMYGSVSNPLGRMVFSRHLGRLGNVVHAATDSVGIQDMFITTIMKKLYIIIIFNLFYAFFLPLNSLKAS